MSFYQKHIFVCTNQKELGKKCCQDAQAKDFFHYIKQRLHDQDLTGPGKIRVSQSGCLGRCSEGPCLVVYPEAVWYTYHTHSDIDETIDSQVLKNIQVKRLILPL